MLIPALNHFKTMKCVSQFVSSFSILKISFMASVPLNFLLFFFYCPGTTPTPLSLRVRRALDHQDMPWQLRYIGQPEYGEVFLFKCLFVRRGGYLAKQIDLKVDVCMVFELENVSLNEAFEQPISFQVIK